MGLPVTTTESAGPGVNWPPAITSAAAIRKSCSSSLLLRSAPMGYYLAAFPLCRQNEMRLRSASCEFLWCRCSPPPRHLQVAGVPAWPAIDRTRSRFFPPHHRPRPDVQAGPRASSPPANQALSGGSGGFPPGSRRRMHATFLSLLGTGPSMLRRGLQYPLGGVFFSHRRSVYLTPRASASFSPRLPAS